MQTNDSRFAEEWDRIHRSLMEAERHFTALVRRAADGSVTMEDLDAERQSLMAQRESCACAYADAFAQTLRPDTPRSPTPVFCLTLG
jgi:hypothetical protein